MIALAAAYLAGISTALLCVFFGMRLAHLYERQASGTAYEPAPQPQQQPQQQPIPDDVAAQFTGEHEPDYWLPVGGPMVPVSERARGAHRRDVNGYQGF